MDPTKNLANYRFGIFYYNPDDPRLIVRKRIKSMGWTINFARIDSVLIFAALAIAFLIFYTLDIVFL